MQHEKPSNGGEQPGLLIALGFLGLMGCATLILGAIIAPIFVPGHDWVADTISDLAAGEHEIIMDVALYGFAGGILATALAAAHAHLGRRRWSLGVLALVVIAALVIVIGARNEYGDKDNEGVVIHIYLVYALGALFLAMPLALARGLADAHHRVAMKMLLGLAVVWGGLAPIFLMSPTSVDGAIERVLGLIASAMIAVLSVIFIQRGRGARR